jgi:lipopolysaccharide exporter
MDIAHSVKKRKSSFRGDVLRLVSGTAAAQLIVLVATPVLTRLFSPEAFGVAAMFMALTGIAGVVACLRYELSIVLPESDREAANLLALSLLIALGVSLLVSLVAWLSGPVILSWINMPELVPYLWLVPVYILVHGIFLGLNYWNTRTKHFKRLAASRVAGSFATTTGALSAGFLGHATGGAMVAAQVGGQAIAAATLGGQIWRSDGRFLASSVDRKEILRGLSRYRKFPLLSSWPALMNSLSWQLPALMLGAFFNPVVVGMYALGLRVFKTPMSLVSKAVSQVFYRHAAETRHTGKLAEVVSGLYRHLLSLALVPCLVLMLTGQELFGFVFGSQWREAGLYAQILAPWAVMWFTSSPLSVVYIALEQQEKEALIQSIILGSRAAALALGGWWGSPLAAIALFSASGLLAYGYLLTVIFRSAAVDLRTAWRSTLAAARVALLFVAPLAAALIIGAPTYAVLALAVITVAVHGALGLRALRSDREHYLHE